ncbi:MAG: methionyl-tRNA formyltransferase [Simkaniaceae bacterium]|nr:methionyl-tRNA formyltransferase [Simkaniaceae bacterium]
MKVVFFGTPQFSADLYTDLVKRGVAIVAVVTKPDKPKGRSGKSLPPPLKEVACCPIFQPEKVSTPEFENLLREIGADLFIVASYGEILKQSTLDIPPLGCINVHTSLLPKYRGAAPIQQAIIEGEVKTGVTIMEMVLQLDAGDILDKEEVVIDPEIDAQELEHLLQKSATIALLRVLDALEKDQVVRIPQDHSKATFVRKITPEFCHINWAKENTKIHQLIRGLSPKPLAWTLLNGKRLKIQKSRLVEGSGAPGEMIGNKNHLIIACGLGAIELLEVQLEGRKMMSGKDLLCGLSILTFTLH